METNTLINITEVRNSRTVAYDITVGEFINNIKNADADGDLDIGVEAIVDADGDTVGFTADKFWELPIIEQFELCVKAQELSRASRITYDIV